MRKFVAILLGLLAGFVVISAVEFASSRVYPPPEGLDPMDREAMAAWIATLPAGAFVFVLVAHALGSLVGAFVCTRAGRGYRAGGVAIGGVLMLAGMVNVWVIEHPTWFVVVDVLVYLPAAIVGSALGGRRSAS